MEYLKKQKLKAFANRFLFPQKDGKGHSRNVPITLEQATQAIDHFVSLRQLENLKPSFIKTRIKVLEICLEEKTPLERWIKVRDFLINRLESQVLNVYITQDTLQDHEVPPWGVLSSLMRPDSFPNWCIKVVVLFNVTDDNVVLPEEIIMEFGSGIEHSFPLHRLTRRGILLKAKTNNGEIIERLIPMNTENFALAWGKDLRNKFSITYSILLDQDSVSHIIRHNYFFDEFKKQYPGFVETYKLDSKMTPVEILERSLIRDAQQKFLEKFTGSTMTKWKWEKGMFTHIDVSKLAREYFRDVKEKIASISTGNIYPRWNPNNHLFDEDLLRYELIDLYLQRFEPYERENLLVHNLENLSIFNLKTFRDLIARWEYDKENGKIVWMIEHLKSNHYKHRKDPKERDKWLEYVRISRLIQEYKKPMLAYRMYRMTVRHNDKVEAIKVEYRRQRKKAIKEGYDIKNPKHLEEIKKKWNLFEAWDLVF